MFTTANVQISDNSVCENSLKHEVYCAFQQHADSKIQSSTDKCVFRYRQSDVRGLLQCPTIAKSGNQIVGHSPDKIVLGSSRKLGGATDHLIDGSEKRICRLSF